VSKRARNERVRLPDPMEARSVEEIPQGPQWQYEPKWDGFRCLLACSRDAAAMRSKSGQDLARYFPEIAAAAVALRETDYVLDGELVIPTADGLSFDDLLQRIHPAESRIKRLAAETPALFIAFDLLMRDGIDLAGMKLSAEMAEDKQRRHRRRDREAARFALPGRQPGRNAEDKDAPDRGLRHRRIPLR
jgi:hypothetical protein